MGLISHSMVMLGVRPNVVRASLMFNEKSGVFWNAVGRQKKDNSYDIEIYKPSIATEKEKIIFRDQHGARLGSAVLELECFEIRITRYDHAQNLAECVQKLAILQKEKESEGFNPETHILRPRFHLPNLKMTAWRHKIEIPHLT